MDELTTYYLSTAELSLTREKLAKLNARAAKRGLAGQVSLEATERRTTEVNEAGFQVTKIFFEVAITGEAPKYNGWSFIATLDWDKSAGLITRTVPGYEGRIDRSALVAGKCDHCQTTRYRKLTYLLRNEQGETRQVGSTCIKDFLGLTVRPVFIYEDDVRETCSLGSAGPAWEYEVSPETALAIAWAAVQTYGFIRSGDYYEVSTRDRIAQVLYPAPFGQAHADDMKVGATLRPIAAQATAQARLIKDFILSDAFTGDSEYVVNLKAVLAGERVSRRNFGLLASAPQAWAREVEKDLRRKAERAEIHNAVIGSVGEKIEITGNVKSIRYIHGNYGTTTLYTLVTTEGNLVKWFASNDTLGDEVTNDTFTLKATVKKHEEYRGQWSTVITRAKVLSKVPAAALTQAA